MADGTRPAHRPFNTYMQQVQQADQAQAIDNGPPPPYTDVDSDDAEDYEQQQQPHHKLTINADHKITGQGNLVPLNPSILSDATRFSAVLLKVIAQLNAAANADGDGHTRPLSVDLTINCGVHVIGSRNVVGNIGMKRKAPVIPTPEGSVATSEVVDVGVGAEGAVIGGAKRKADDGDDEVSLLVLFTLPLSTMNAVLTMTQTGHRR